MSEIVRGRRRGVRWTSVGYGLHVRTDEPQGTPVQLIDRLRAWRLALAESAVFTDVTVAALRGWWLSASTSSLVYVAVGPHDPHPQRRGLRVLRLQESPERVLVGGLPVATAAQTVLAAARHLALLDLVPLVDSAVRSGDCTVEELAQLAQHRRRGAPRLRAVLPHVDARSESAWESIMRVLDREAGVEVEPQHVVLDAAGRFVARGDLWLVGTRRLHEYDGEGHRDLPTHRRDLDRDRRLSGGSGSATRRPRCCTHPAPSSPPSTPSCSGAGTRSGWPAGGRWWRSRRTGGSPRTGTGTAERWRI